MQGPNSADYDVRGKFRETNRRDWKPFEIEARNAAV